MIGYARVSTPEQSLDLQTDALRRHGVEPEQIHVEKVSSADKKRRKLEWALGLLRPGDTLVVWKLDRLARNVRELYRILGVIEENKAKLRSLTETIDTGTPIGRMLFTILGCVAQFERDLIAERTRAGMAIKKANGWKPGPRRLLSETQISDIRKRAGAGEWVSDIAGDYPKVSVHTVRRYALGLDLKQDSGERNKAAATCFLCRADVRPGKGFVQSVRGKSVVRCIACVGSGDQIAN